MPYCVRQTIQGHTYFAQVVSADYGPWTWEKPSFDFYFSEHNNRLDKTQFKTLVIHLNSPRAKLSVKCSRAEGGSDQDLCAAHEHEHDERDGPSKE